MSPIYRYVILGLIMAGGVFPLAHAVATTSDSSASHTADLIKGEYDAQHVHFRLQSVKAVSQLDDMLVGQYGARGRMSAEPNAELKPIYYQAATLLMNGYPIAGGTLVNFARLNPTFAKSPAGPALGLFVDAMLQPTGEDDAELRAYEQRGKVALDHVRLLPKSLQVPSQVLLLGEVYDDQIAVAAGKQALIDGHASAADMLVITEARSAMKRIAIPKGE